MSTSDILIKLDSLTRHNKAKLDEWRATSKRDGDNPLSSPGKPVDFREDTYLASERNELRTGALSKADTE